MAEDDTEKGYRWETEYEKTCFYWIKNALLWMWKWLQVYVGYWEAIREDDDGSLKTSIDDIVHKAKRRRLLEKIGSVRLGMMRHLFLILDMSESMKDQDLKPTRLISTLKLLEYFVEEYFDQNPISQLGIIGTRNKRAEKIAELGGNPRRHISTLQGLTTSTCVGEPSLQNSLEVAINTLRNMPGHASREVLIIFGSLTTCDPGNVIETIQAMKDTNIRCSVIGLAAEIRVCKKLCMDTNGLYNVILDETHFKDLLLQHVDPPPAAVNTEASLIRMGFPHHLLGGSKDKEMPSMCMCHLDSKTNEGFGGSGYFCPQCKSKYCELPVECKACGLTLVSAPHLARSYHHLFPLDPYKEIPTDSNTMYTNLVCYACRVDLKKQNVCMCEKCQQIFCVDCDLFIHETLHSCPGCASSRTTQHLSKNI